MMTPLIHLNGTSATQLMEANRAAGLALYNALRKLEDTAPHARDYYVRGDNAFNEAVKEHTSRCERIKAVIEELASINDDIVLQLTTRNGIASLDRPL